MVVGTFLGFSVLGVGASLVGFKAFFGFFGVSGLRVLGFRVFWGLGFWKLMVWGFGFQGLTLHRKP